MNKLVKIAFCSATALTMNLACGADLTIHIDDVDAAEGKLMVALYTSQGTFLKTPSKAGSTPAAAHGGTVAGEGVSPCV